MNFEAARGKDDERWLRWAFATAGQGVPRLPVPVPGRVHSPSGLDTFTSLDKPRQEVHAALAGVPAADRGTPAANPSAAGHEYQPSPERQMLGSQSFAGRRGTTRG